MNGGLWFPVSLSVRPSRRLYIVSSCVNNAPPLWSMSRGRLSASKVRDDDKRKTRQTLMWWSVNKPQTNDLSKWVFVRSFITILGAGHPSISFAGSGSGVALMLRRRRRRFGQVTFMSHLQEASSSTNMAKQMLGSLDSIVVGQEELLTFCTIYLELPLAHQN